MLMRLLFDVLVLATASLAAVVDLSTHITFKGIQQSKRDDNLPARVPYVFPPPGTDALAERIRRRRPNGTLLDLDGVLLNSHNIALGWNSMFEIIRGNTTIPGDMRELIILRVAVLNSAAYQWIQHEPVARSENVTTSQLQAIRFQTAFSSFSNDTQNFTPSLAAAMELTDHMTVNVHIPDSVFGNFAQFFNDSQVVETMATAGSYNFVSRFVVGLNIDGKMDVEVPVPQ